MPLSLALSPLRGAREESRLEVGTGYGSETGQQKEAHQRCEPKVRGVSPYRVMLTAPRGAREVTRRMMALPRRDRAGLTLLEMLVSTTLLVFIMVGLTAMFVQTQKAFQAGTKQAAVTDVGGTVADMIATDLAQLSDAKNPAITNLFFGWVPLNYTIQSNSGTTFVRTNQAQDIFMLVRTNGQWEGIGYGVSNSYPGCAGAGTLYRFVVQTNAPLTNNSLFSNFLANVSSQTFSGPNCHRVADGVIHLKISAFDPFGNEDPYEQGHDYDMSTNSFTYPLPVAGTNVVLVTTNDLPGSIQLEVGVLEPDTYAQARALSATSGALETSFLGKAAASVHVFREEIPIAGVVR